MRVGAMGVLIMLAGVLVCPALTLKNGGGSLEKLLDLLYRSPSTFFDVWWLLFRDGSGAWFAGGGLVVLVIETIAARRPPVVVVYATRPQPPPAAHWVHPQQPPKP